jgi:hypothetical protein
MLSIFTLPSLLPSEAFSQIDDEKNSLPSAAREGGLSLVQNMYVVWVGNVFLYVVWVGNVFLVSD